MRVAVILVYLDRPLNMAISFPLAFPTATGISSVTIQPNTVVSVTRSPFTHEAEILVHQGQWIEANVILPKMKRANFAAWEAFRLKLNGQEGTFTMGIPDHDIARGSASSAPGTPVVKGGSQTGNSFDMDGAPNNATGYLKELDLIQLGTGATARLYMVLNDADSDGVGNVTLDIWPKITAANSPIDNATVVVASCIGLWRMATNLMSWSANTAAIYGLEFSAISEV